MSKKRFPELKDGYVVKVRDYDLFSTEYTDSYAMICHDHFDDLCVSGEKVWWPVSEFDPNGRYDDSIVLAVYGRTFAKDAWKVDTEDRELLWEIDPDDLAAFDAEVIVERTEYGASKGEKKSEQDLAKLMDDKVAELVAEGMDRKTAEKVVALCALSALNIAMQTDILK